MNNLIYKSMENNKVFMAVAVGKAAVEGTFKMYKGIGAFNILAVNPTKEELGKLQDREIDKDIEYLGKDDDGNTTLRVTLWAKTNPESKVNNGIDLMVPITFNLTKKHKVGANSGKAQVIDKYGRTAWATKEEFTNKLIPQYANGPANIDKDYRLAYDGEEFLINFLIAWLNIPGPANYKDGKWVMRPNPVDSEVSLDMEKLFKGDVSEIKELVDIAKEYIVKAAVGIRTTDEGKQYHNVFIREFVKNSVSKFDKIGKAIDEFKANGGAASIEYSTESLHENVVEATNFDAPVAAAKDDCPW